MEKGHYKLDKDQKGWKYFNKCIVEPPILFQKLFYGIPKIEYTRCYAKVIAPKGAEVVVVNNTMFRTNKLKIQEIKTSDGHKVKIAQAPIYYHQEYESWKTYQSELDTNLKSCCEKGLHAYLTKTDLPLKGNTFSKYVL